MCVWPRKEPLPLLLLLLLLLLLMVLRCWLVKEWCGAARAGVEEGDVVPAVSHEGCVVVRRACRATR